MCRLNASARKCMHKRMHTNTYSLTNAILHKIQHQNAMSNEMPFTQQTPYTNCVRVFSQKIERERKRETEMMTKMIAGIIK